MEIQGKTSGRNSLAHTRIRCIGGISGINQLLKVQEMNKSSLLRQNKLMSTT